MTTPQTKILIAGLELGKWYCAMHRGYNNSQDVDSDFFKFLGDDSAEIDSNACGEPNYFAPVPDADYYIAIM